MTDAELIAAIAKILHSRPRLKTADRASAEARDLARFDQIVGLINRHLEGGAA
jgi:hypothetical protein